MLKRQSCGVPGCRYARLFLGIIGFSHYFFLVLGYLIDSNHRLFSGWLTAVTSSVLTFTFLDILFLGVGMQLAEVALYIMAVNSTLVGMSLGILLPKFFPGVCLGAEVALLVVSFVSAPASVPSDVYFPALAGSLIAIFSLLSLRYVTHPFPMLND